MGNNPPLRILIVDDNELTRSLLQVILRSAEYQVIGEAADAQTGLAKAKAWHPDIVLLDNNMPNGQGIDIIVPIKQALPKTVILMVTAQGDDVMVKAAMERGASGFVIKPFNTESVLGTIKKVKDKFFLAVAAGLQI
jgi:two-component system chemotaxis response regulator CheY